jgi:ribosomal protein S18 acetylase RimI-like enzyme
MEERIRRFEARDAIPVADLWHRAGRATYTYLPSWQAFERDHARAVFRDVIASSCEIWVGETDGEAVAYLALNGSYVDRLYVDPPMHGQGWGARLLDHAKRLHPAGLTLHTHRENHRARAFYERHGFVVTGFGVSPPPESAPDVAYRWAPGRS